MLAGLSEENEAEIFQPQNYIQNFLWIESKEQEIIPFILNDIQIDYLTQSSWMGEPFRGMRDIILKARQHGFTTLILAIYFHNTVMNHATNTVICGPDVEAAQKLLEKVKLMYSNLPEKIKPRVSYDNKNELYFPDLRSRIQISTQGKGVRTGRSSTINNLLCTEVAFWKKAKEVMKGLTNSVPMSGNIVIESTPAMLGGYYYNEVQNSMKGDSVYKLHEYPWHANPDYEMDLSFNFKEIIKLKYNVAKKPIWDKEEKKLIRELKLTPEQMMWRRYKMLEAGDMTINKKTAIHRSRDFSQEYECDFTQSGNPWIDSSYIIPIVHFSEPVKGRKYVHGIDTSEGLAEGDDCALVTLDFETGEQVAGFQGTYAPTEAGLKIHRHCKRYGGLVGIEVNNTGLAVIERVWDNWQLDYAKLYINKPKEVDYWLYNDGKRFGWFTSGKSRVVMFADGWEALRDGDIQIAIDDQILKNEIIACQKNDKGKPEAPEEATDHSLLALLVAWQMRKHYNQLSKRQSQGAEARVIG